MVKSNIEKTHSIINKENNSIGEELDNKVKNIAKDIEDTLPLKESLQGEKQNENTNISDTIIKADSTLKAVNSIRVELCKLPLDPCERQYYENSIFPLISVLNYLSNTSANLSTSTNVLTNSSILFRKESKIKDTLKLVYDLNEQCEEIYEELRKRIDILLKE